MNKNCIQCGSPILGKNAHAVYCSKACGNSYRYKSNNRSTAYQYALTSGNWRLYYQRRISEKQRSATLDVEQLLELHAKQQGKCALTGVDLTCTLIPGKRTPTNASVDRIDAKGAYVIENIQLVCVAVNRLRCDMSTDEFINWCTLVANKAKGVAHDEQTI